MWSGHLALLRFHEPSALQGVRAVVAGGAAAGRHHSGGTRVGVWEADPRGRLRLLAASSDDVAPLADELEAMLRELGELPGARPLPRRWVASRLDEHRWLIA